MDDQMRSSGKVTRRNWGIGLFLAGSSAVTVPRLVAEGRPTPPDMHPLDAALRIAREGLDFMRQQVRDYTCTIVKRERIRGGLGEYNYMSAKIRHRREADGSVHVPFSVYLKFLKPKAIEGREVIWVEGRNEGNLIAHEAGLLNIKRIFVAPDSFIAMMGQKYPITKIGAQNLIEELILRGERDRKHGECEVQFFQNAAINKRPCRMIQVVHPIRRPHFDFHKAQIYIDHEWKIPVRYVAWNWPATPGGELILEEEYTYLDVKINVDLTDRDFAPDNPDYNFPRL